MGNDEVLRLRKLRITALRVRAIARAFAGSHQEQAVNDWLDRIAGASWRVSRAISGRLRAHPYATFQKDAGPLTLLANSLRAYVAAHCLRQSGRAGNYLAAELSRLERTLDDARALTCTLELSDSFGRSLIEIRALLADFWRNNQSPAHAAALPSVLPARSSSRAADIDLDWPYLTL